MTSRPEKPIRPASLRAARPARVAGAAAGAAGALAMVIGGFLGIAEPAIIPQAAAAPSDQPEADEFGYLDSAARCDADQTLVAYGRTSRAQVAICVDPAGIIRKAPSLLRTPRYCNSPAGRAADGSIVATNGDATYAVSPSTLLVSEGDSVIYRGSWIEFREPGFDAGAGSSSSSSPSSTSSAPSSSPATSQTPAEPATDSPSEDSLSEVPTTTVSTTTVTITAEAG